MRFAAVGAAAVEAMVCAFEFAGLPRSAAG